MSNLRFVFTRLWRYLSIYFLKPFDAINDTLVSSLLTQYEWPDEVVEIASGDGVFSYVMHGGVFPLWFDRYLQVDPEKKDIFDIHKYGLSPQTHPPSQPVIAFAVDVKRSHANKTSEIGYAREVVCSDYEHLSIVSNSIPAIFYYIPHGVRNHKKVIEEVRRVLEQHGTLLILLYDRAFEASFLCHKYGNLTKGKLSKYLLKLDNGRFKELTKLSDTLEGWIEYFSNNGFKVEETKCGLSSVAWKAYDVQTRPILRVLIRITNWFPIPIRTVFKLTWMLIWFPVLLVFYFLFSNDFIVIDKQNCYVTLRLRKK